MARDELVELLARVRRGVALGELRECVPLIHKELAEIQRKRSHFLEDACAAVLKQSFASSGSWGHDSESESDREIADAADTASELLGRVTVCAAFVEPLARGLPPRHAGEDSDVTRQRAVLVAFILAVLGRPELTPDDAESRELQDAYHLLASLALASGIDLLTIAWTLRFREELHMFRSMMLPTQDHSDSENDDDEDDGDDGESDGDDDDGDDAWITRAVAAAAGCTGSLVYFLKETGQEYAFASWSPVGIVRLVVLLATATDSTLSSGVSSLSICSSYSSLFALGVVAQAPLQAQTIQSKRYGLTVLKHALDKCVPGSLVIGGGPSNENSGSKQVSFAAASEAFRQRDWITPLVELASNAMVSFPEANDRALGLTVFRQLLQVVEVAHRFYLIRRLALRCPYGNVAAILIDQLRNDTFRVWSTASVIEGTPYMSSDLTSLIIDLLKLLAERDLKLHADLLASVASLIRFVAIRDKENRSGLRTPDTLRATKELLDRLQSRLRATIADGQLATSASDPSSLHALLHDDNARFVLVEAALQSTIGLLSN